jgi:hypothetical protein
MKVSDFRKGQTNAMNNRFNSLIASTALAAALVLSTGAVAYQAPRQAPAATGARAAAPPTASDKDIADARSKGLVWVNTSSRVYHKDGQFYGKTKQGKFMTEADAQKAGYRSAKDPNVGKKKPLPTKK